MQQGPFGNIKTDPPFASLAGLWQARVASHGAKTFVYFGNTQYSYQAMWERAAKAAGLLHLLGAQKGEHVAVWIPNSPDFLTLWFAAMLGGYVAVTVNTLLKALEVEYILNDCDARILVTTPHFWQMLQPVRDRLKLQHILLTEPANFTGTRNLHDALMQAEPFLANDLTRSDKVEIIYTSGTTGHPKGVVLSHGNLLYNSYVTHQLIDLQENDTALCIMPLFHVNAQIASMLSTLWAGASVVLEDGFKPRTFIDTLKKYRCTTFSGVPTIYNYLNELPEAEGEDLSFLKACICGAAPMPVEVFNKFEAKFRGKIIEGYGLSEGTCVSSLNPLYGQRKIGSIGLPIPGQEMAIANARLDERIEFLPDGEIGEIVIRGPNVMQGYYKKEEATRATIVGGWLRTGDLGQRDSDGYFYITGRKKEMIIQGGENIYPKEIEEELYRFPPVAECAVVGLPDKKYGEIVAAFIILKEGFSTTAAEIRAFLRDKIANYKIPKVVEFVTRFPKTATGKIQKSKIVEEYLKKS
ncbi:MAG: long-chain fatty acid--CoA ligase [Turneriella sp.]|nr:long-chain fatty acid--CoA ligase [Turneriella sp.]